MDKTSTSYQNILNKVATSLAKPPFLVLLDHTLVTVKPFVVKLYESGWIRSMAMSGS